MPRILVFPLLFLLIPAVSAQQSSSYRISDHVWNAGGHPSGGALLASSSYRITLDAIGAALPAPELSSPSYRMDGSFAFCYPPPAEVLDLRFTDAETLAWRAERSAGAYNLYRGSLTNVAEYGKCFEPEIATNTTTDGDWVSPGHGFFYLVTAENRLDEEGTKGWSSGGNDRPGAVCP